MSRPSERERIPETERIRLLEYDADRHEARLESFVKEIKAEVTAIAKSTEAVDDNVDRKLNAFQSSMTKTVIGLLGGVIVALTIQLILAFSQGP